MHGGDAGDLALVVQLDHMRCVAVGDMRNRVRLVGAHLIGNARVFPEERLPFELLDAARVKGGFLQ